MEAIQEDSENEEIEEDFSELSDGDSDGDGSDNDGGQPATLNPSGLEEPRIGVDVAADTPSASPAPTRSAQSPKVPTPPPGPAPHGGRRRPFREAIDQGHQQTSQGQQPQHQNAQAESLQHPQQDPIWEQLEAPPGSDRETAASLSLASSYSPPPDATFGRRPSRRQLMQQRSQDEAPVVITSIRKPHGPPPHAESRTHLPELSAAGMVEELGTCEDSHIEDAEGKACNMNPAPEQRSVFVRDGSGSVFTKGLRERRDEGVVESRRVGDTKVDDTSPSNGRFREGARYVCQDESKRVEEQEATWRVGDTQDDDPEPSDGLVRKGTGFVRPEELGGLEEEAEEEAWRVGDTRVDDAELPDGLVRKRTGFVRPEDLERAESEAEEEAWRVGDTKVGDAEQSGGLVRKGTGFVHPEDLEGIEDEEETCGANAKDDELNRPDSMVRNGIGFARPEDSEVFEEDVEAWRVGDWKDNEPERPSSLVRKGTGFVSNEYAKQLDDEAVGERWRIGDRREDVPSKQAPLIRQETGFVRERPPDGSGVEDLGGEQSEATNEPDVRRQGREEEAAAGQSCFGWQPHGASAHSTARAVAQEYLWCLVTNIQKDAKPSQSNRCADRAGSSRPRGQSEPRALDGKSSLERSVMQPCLRKAASQRLLPPLQKPRKRPPRVPSPPRVVVPSAIDARRERLGAHYEKLWAMQEELRAFEEERGFAKMLGFKQEGPCSPREHNTQSESMTAKALMAPTSSTVARLSARYSQRGAPPGTPIVKTAHFRPCWMIQMHRY